MELVNGDVTFEPTDPRIDPIALGSLCSKLLEEAECSICLWKLHDELSGLFPGLFSDVKGRLSYTKIGSGRE